MPFIPPKIPTMICMVVGLVQEKDAAKGFYSALSINATLPTTTVTTTHTRLTVTEGCSLWDLSVSGTIDYGFITPKSRASLVLFSQLLKGDSA